MKRIKRVFVGIMAATLLFVNCTTAYAASTDAVVYITETGTCYHTGECSSLKKSKYPVGLQDAVEANYTPCSKCKPPTLTVEDTNASKKTMGASNQKENMVWLSATGSKYHSKNNCGNMNPAKATQVTESDAIDLGKTRCSKCWK